MPQLKLTAVTIPAMHATMFVVNFAAETLPAFVDWSDWAITDDVRLIVPDDLSSWPDGAEAPEAAILGRSIGNPKSYELFKRAADFRAAEFIPTGMAYGGVYSESHWGRFVSDFPRVLKFLQVPAMDSPGILEEVLPGTKRDY